ncbi:MAG: prepilin-type N-terminal cleavage/methylation domain-containing protein [Candidatus Omnitrophica bacterium]|nr:prepilin-type N-terminal cleavage/methylation domain-containing protein [Candidatus Omnitrophota bacterium]
MSNRGFSLLELIITIAILSIGIVSILQTISFSGQVWHKAQDSTRAVFLAQDIMQKADFDELRGMIIEGVQEGKTKGLNWKSYIRPLAESELYQMDLEVAWGQPPIEDQINITTYLRAR